MNNQVSLLGLIFLLFYLSPLLLLRVERFGLVRGERLPRVVNANWSEKEHGEF
jgi:hypothetical protein